MTAGTSPSFTSEKANVALLDAMTTSQAAKRPVPPPRAAPWTAATTGLRKV